MSTSHDSHTQAIEPGIYEHFKGAKYEVLGLALDAEKGTETKIVYRTQGSSNLYYRSPENFKQMVQNAEDMTVPRFRKVDHEPA